ncbi:MAG: ATP-binding protein, partial [Microvirga sp.]
MPSLNFDLVRRVERLPKPVRTTDALQPLFEAISNSIHSVQDKFKAKVAELGHIEVSINKPRGKRRLSIIVSDNGVGLDETNYEAFTTTDTGNKIAIGGKGVGRLLWL